MRKLSLGFVPRQNALWDKLSEGTQRLSITCPIVPNPRAIWWDTGSPASVDSEMRIVASDRPLVARF